MTPTQLKNTKNISLAQPKIWRPMEIKHSKPVFDVKSWSGDSFMSKAALANPAPCHVDITRPEAPKTSMHHRARSRTPARWCIYSTMLSRCLSARYHLWTNCKNEEGWVILFVRLFHYNSSREELTHPDTSWKTMQTVRSTLSLDYFHIHPCSKSFIFYHVWARLLALRRETRRVITQVWESWHARDTWYRSNCQKPTQRWSHCAMQARGRRQFSQSWLS